MTIGHLYCESYRTRNVSSVNILCSYPPVFFLFYELTLVFVCELSACTKQMDGRTDTRISKSVARFTWTDSRTASRQTLVYIHLANIDRSSRSLHRYTQRNIYNKTTIRGQNVLHHALVASLHTTLVHASHRVAVNLQ